MNYESKARPIRTSEELEAAISAGAQLEFTCCGDTYAAPRRHGGWVMPFHNGNFEWIRKGLSLEEYRDGSDRLRAFYPARRPLLSRLAFWRKAA